MNKQLIRCQRIVLVAVCQKFQLSSIKFNFDEVNLKKETLRAMSVLTLCIRCKSAFHFHLLISSC